MKISRNMGPVDQTLRTLIGIALIYLGPVSHILTSDFMSGVLLGFIGILNIASSAIGYCPMYQMAGFFTYKPKELPKE